MKKGNKLIAVVITLVILSGILFSYEYIAGHTLHDCPGKDCMICGQLEEAAQFISGIKYNPVLLFLMALFVMSAKICTIIKKHILVKNTLVTLKVELLN